MFVFRRITLLLFCSAYYELYIFPVVIARYYVAQRSLYVRMRLELVRSADDSAAVWDHSP